MTDVLHVAIFTIFHNARAFSTDKTRPRKCGHIFLHKYDTFKINVL